MHDKYQSFFVQDHLPDWRRYTDEVVLYKRYICRKIVFSLGELDYVASDRMLVLIYAHMVHTYMALLRT